MFYSIERRSDPNGIVVREKHRFRARDGDGTVTGRLESKLKGFFEHVAKRERQAFAGSRPIRTR
jgi:hypothetical protein